MYIYSYVVVHIHTAFPAATRLRLGGRRGAVFPVRGPPLQPEDDSGGGASRLINIILIIKLIMIVITIRTYKHTTTNDDTHNNSARSLAENK